MVDERFCSEEETIRVAAPVGDPGLPVASEVMHALPDPADEDQAVLISTPFLTDELNYGDIVRLGPEDEWGVRPILGAVVASGHVHFLVATDPGAGDALVAELERTLPAYSLRVARAQENLFSVSLHPDLDTDAVMEIVEAWLGVDADEDELEDGPAIGPLCETTLGPLATVG
jgi:hypothetical protein